MSAFGWLVTALVLSCVAGAGIAGYLFYKFRLRVGTERSLPKPKSRQTHRFFLSS